MYREVIRMQHFVRHRCIKQPLIRSLLRTLAVTLSELTGCILNRIVGCRKIPLSAMLPRIWSQAFCADYGERKTVKHCFCPSWAFDLVEEDGHVKKSVEPSSSCQHRLLPNTRNWLKAEKRRFWHMYLKIPGVGLVSSRSPLCWLHSQAASLLVCPTSCPPLVAPILHHPSPQQP